MGLALQQIDDPIIGAGGGDTATLYGVARNIGPGRGSGLVTINKSTGIATAVGSLTNFGATGILNPTGLEFHKDVLYMCANNPVALYTINTTTGRATIVNSEITNFGLSGVSINPQGLVSDGVKLFMNTESLTRAPAALYELLES